MVYYLENYILERRSNSFNEDDGMNLNRRFETATTANIFGAPRVESRKFKRMLVGERIEKIDEYDHQRWHWSHKWEDLSKKPKQ